MGWVRAGCELGLSWVKEKKKQSKREVSANTAKHGSKPQKMPEGTTDREAPKRAGASQNTRLEQDSQLTGLSEDKERRAINPRQMHTKTTTVVNRRMAEESTEMAENTAKCI